MAGHAGGEILQGLRVFSLPSRAKWFLLGLLFFTGAVNTALFVFGILEHSKHEWVKASLELMSVILPFMVLAVVLFFSSSIAEQAKAKTIGFLLRSTPQSLSGLIETAQPFASQVARIRTEHIETPKTVAVLVRHSPGSCCADYLLAMAGTPTVESSGDFELFLRLELNVKRLTVNIGVEKARIPTDLLQDENQVLSWFRQNFVNSICGAGVVSPHPTSVQGGYQFDRTINRDADGRAFICFVATRDLGNDFLWDASEQLFILQDLAFMLRAILSEQPSLFSRLKRAN
jgi:hypothetical protein